MLLADCFIFYNELTQLELRLHELDPLVDRFVLLEARQTFTGKDKPLFFAENKDRFAKYLGKIKHIVIDKFPDTDNPWDREHFQRNALADGVADLAPDHPVMLSDVDEFPRRDALKRVLEERLARRAMVAFGLDAYNFRLNFRVPPARVQWWFGSRIVERRYFESPQLIRSIKLHPSKRAPFLAPLQRRMQTWRKLGAPIGIVPVPRAGWHLTWLGDHRAYVDKINAFSHQEFNRPDIVAPARFERLISQGMTLLNETEEVRFEIATIEELPLLVQEQPERFRQLLVP